MSGVIQGVRLSRGQIGLLVRLHRRGWSQRDVADALGCSQQCVKQWLRRLELQPNGYHTTASKQKRSVSAKRQWASMRQIQDEVTELVFPWRGPTCGYRVFSALCRQGWPIHGRRDVQILVEGERLLVRCGVDLAEQLLRLLPGGVRRRLYPAQSLASRIVVVKGKTEAGTMAEYLQGQLDARGILSLLEVGERRVLWLHGYTIVGFAVHVSGLRPEQSLRLQAEGFGGKQRFGCGVLAPC